MIPRLHPVLYVAAALLLLCALLGTGCQSAKHRARWIAEAEPQPRAGAPLETAAASEPNAAAGRESAPGTTDEGAGWLGRLLHPFTGAPSHWLAPVGGAAKADEPAPLKDTNVRQLCTNSAKNRTRSAKSVHETPVSVHELTDNRVGQSSGPQRADFGPGPGGERRYIRALKAYASSTKIKVKGDGNAVPTNTTGDLTNTSNTGKKSITIAADSAPVAVGDGAAAAGRDASGHSEKVPAPSKLEQIGRLPMELAIGIGALLAVGTLGWWLWPKRKNNA